MPEEFFDLAYINFDKVILHGRVMTGTGLARKEHHIEQVLTDEQKRLVEDIQFKHQRELEALLGGFVDRDALNAQS